MKCRRKLQTWNPDVHHALINLVLFIFDSWSIHQLVKSDVEVHLAVYLLGVICHNDVKSDIVYACFADVFTAVLKGKHIALFRDCDEGWRILYLNLEAVFIELDLP